MSPGMSKKKPLYKSLRFFIVSLILLAVLACILPFFLKGLGNKKLISPDQIKLPEMNFLKKQPQDTRTLPTSQNSAPRIKLKKIYKWKDKNGTLHFTDYPNPDGPSELIMATPDKPDEHNSVAPTNTSSDQKGLKSDDNPSTIAFPMSLSPSKIKKLKQDAEKVRKDLEDRFGEMEGMQDK
jgi:hypothetical protein